MEINSVRGLVIDTIANKLAYNGNHISSDMCDKKLLGEAFGLQARDLVKLLFLLEENLGIRFSQNDLVDRGFSTINQISNLAFRLMAEKKSITV